MGRSWLIGSLAGSVLASGLGLYAQSSQLPVISSQHRHTNGQSVVPLYRGWYRGKGTQVYLAFEYLNRNSEETLEIPIGPNNAIAPGLADQSQPTHFLPGHQHGVFVVPLPTGLATEITWTLSSRGETFTTPANLDPLYQIEGLINHGGSFPGNTPPFVQFATDGPAAQGPGGLMTAIDTTIESPISLDVWVTDDGLPPPPSGRKVIRSLQRAYRRGGASEEGVTVTWSKYRGPGTVSFLDASPDVEQGKASTSATFNKSGEYMLRALVSDGSGFDGCCWTNAYVKVKVGS